MVDKTARQRDRVSRWAGDAAPVETPTTAMDRHVNRAWELARTDGLPRYVYYAPDQSGLIYIGKTPPPEGVPAFVLVDGKRYPALVRR